MFRGIAVSLFCFLTGSEIEIDVASLNWIPLTFGSKLNFFFAIQLYALTNLLFIYSSAKVIFCNGSLIKTKKIRLLELFQNSPFVITARACSR